eukprot:SAG31_NODE_48663_length_175_cov_43.552632_1_plen_36_part_01
MPNYPVRIARAARARVLVLLPNGKLKSDRNTSSTNP